MGFAVGHPGNLGHEQDPLDSQDLFKAHMGNPLSSSKWEILQPAIVWGTACLLETRGGMGEHRCLAPPWSPWAAAGLSKHVFVQKFWISSR